MSAKLRRGRLGLVLLFCGPPGSLKTYLSVRVSAKLGFGYLPTRVAGELASGLSPHDREKERGKRYKRLAQGAEFLAEMGASIVLDGGFESRRARTEILQRLDPRRVILVQCTCDDEEVRRRRLLMRSADDLDHEAKSAHEILLAGSEVRADSQHDPLEEVRDGRVVAALTVDTVSRSIHWTGEAPDELRLRLTGIIAQALEEYSQTDAPHSRETSVAAHFDALAEVYDYTTEWVQNDEILDSLHKPLPLRPSRVLDIGTGTGLVGAWYSEQGHHVVGIDLSPKMLRRAAARLTLTVFGNAVELPFLDDYFDLVLVRQVLHYLNPTSLLADATRTLKRDGGLFALSAAVCSNDQSQVLWREFKSLTQPLRLDVYTEADLTRLLGEAGLDVLEIRRLSLTRQESVGSIAKRAPAPHGGWASFFRNFERLASTCAGMLEFKFHGDEVEYQQHWVTIWGVRAGDAAGKGA